ncbi:MAG: efflux RND transporter permease subunit [Thalassotalea sp.]
MWLRKLIENHVLTNLFFVLVLFMGFLVYQQLPRQQDPSINFNWVQITTILPGAAAKDVEQKVTDIIEESVEKIQDIKFVSSTSRESVSSILVRFHDINQEQFDKRLADLRREVNNAEDKLPQEAERPDIFEITSSNAFPTATVVVSGPADDENLRRQAHSLEKDLARIPGVDRVMDTGLREPELQVQFDIEKIRQLNLSPIDIANSIQAFFKDVSAGSARIAQDQWLVRIQGTSTDPEVLAQMPILAEHGDLTEIRLSDVANIVRARSKITELVRFQGKPAVLFSVMKQENLNTLQLVKRVSDFVNEKNLTSQQVGVEFILVDDQTLTTRNALNIMQTNALFGLFFVLIVTWLFLGTKVSLLVTIGIPFTLAGTFIVLQMLGQTLNTSVLLAIVIALGMLVDDAVVVVESIYYKLRQGIETKVATWTGLIEVIKPVSASVLTTMAAFLPLMLLPGILGKFMMIIPLVVTVALAFSLVEAYWMLPGHINVANIKFDKTSKVDNYRQHVIHKLKIKYGVALLKVMRHPKKTLAVLMLLLALAFSAIAAGMIKMDFFASDNLRLYYVDIEMPATSSIEETMDKVVEIENITRSMLTTAETRSIVSYAGQVFTQTEPLFGEQLGQVFISLNPKTDDMRSVDELVAQNRKLLADVVGPVNVSFLIMKGGPPVTRPISVKVRGDNYQEIRNATDDIAKFMKADAQYKDISDDDSKGRFGLNLTINYDAVNRLGFRPDDIQRIIRMLIDGEIISYVQEEGDRVALRLRSIASAVNEFTTIDELLNISIPSPSGTHIELRDLLNVETNQVKANIRHYNFKRAITLESDIDKTITDTVKANTSLQEFWAKIAKNYPNVSLDFSGELDDIAESQSAIFALMMFGIGVMYLILSTQFQSYFQPLMILLTVPLAFIGVVLGLLVSNNPLSLFTMYGIVALTGIAVNSSIVLISTANNNLKKGMTLIHATFYAARRRVLPILITTLTTVAGLFSLASGLGGSSLIWSPVATSIVWGLMCSSFLTLFAIPALYQLVMRKSTIIKNHKH